MSTTTLCVSSTSPSSVLLRPSPSSGTCSREFLAHAARLCCCRRSLLPVRFFLGF